MATCEMRIRDVAFCRYVPEDQLSKSLFRSDPVREFVLSGGTQALLVYHLPLVLFGPFYYCFLRNDLSEFRTVEIITH